MEKSNLEQEVKNKVKEILIEVLQLDDKNPDSIPDDQLFFGNEKDPGLIEDSLAVLEISTRLADEYDIMPSDFNQESFVNVNSLSKMIMNHIDK